MTTPYTLMPRTSEFPNQRTGLLKKSQAMQQADLDAKQAETENRKLQAQALSQKLKGITPSRMATPEEMAARDVSPEVGDPSVKAQWKSNQAAPSQAPIVPVTPDFTNASPGKQSVGAPSAKSFSDLQSPIKVTPFAPNPPAPSTGSVASGAAPSMVGQDANPAPVALNPIARSVAPKPLSLEERAANLSGQPGVVGKVALTEGDKTVTATGGKVDGGGVNNRDVNTGLPSDGIAKAPIGVGLPDSGVTPGDKLAMDKTNGTGSFASVLPTFTPDPANAVKQAAPSPLDIVDANKFAANTVHSLASGGDGTPKTADQLPSTPAAPDAMAGIQPTNPNANGVTAQPRQVKQSALDTASNPASSPLLGGSDNSTSPATAKKKKPDGTEEA